MYATVLLCVISTTVFCICLRLLVSLMSVPKPMMVLTHSSFSIRSRRVIRSYLIFSMAVLSLMALAIAIRAYLELFQVNL